MTLPVVFTDPAELDQFQDDDVIGLVPTMGALHDGHGSLIRTAASECDIVIVSIFVNPTQFNDANDLARYPRRLELDRAFAGEMGATAIYAPEQETIYPHGHSTRVSVSGITDRWEGAHRPGHFDGVATVVTILLNQVRPHRSYFGEKDWQQLTMIRQMSGDLCLPGDIIACPTVRDRDGLALSSRNARLSHDERRAALAIPRALDTMRRTVASGETRTSAVIAAGRSVLERSPSVRAEYLTIVDPNTLEEIGTIQAGSRALAAARVGDTRLIDTMDLTHAVDQEGSRP